MNGKRGAPIGNQNATRHGLNALKRRVKVRGTEAIDKRTTAGKNLIASRNGLIRDCGGEAQVDTMQRILIQNSSVKQVCVSHLSAYLLEQPSLVDKRRKTVIPAVLQLKELMDSMARDLQLLNQTRGEKPPLGRKETTITPEVASKIVEEIYGINDTTPPTPGNVSGGATTQALDIPPELARSIQEIYEAQAAALPDERPDREGD